MIAGPHETVRREAHTKAGYCVSCRFGDPVFPHVLAITAMRHDNRDGQMVLTALGIEHVEAVPGSPQALIDRLAAILPKAKDRADEGLGDVLVIIDVTRQLTVWRLVQEKVQASVYLVVTTHGRLLSSTPYWHIGRVTLLSYFSTAVARGIVQFFLPKADDPRLWTAEQVRAALVAARNKPPKMELDELDTETNTEDDVSLALAMAAMYAEMSAPDCFVDLTKRKVRFAS